MAQAEQVARKFAEAASKGDVETLKSLIAEDCVLHIPGRSQISGTHKGRDQALAVFGKTSELTGGTIKRELHDVTGSDTHAVNLVRVTAQRGGKAYSWNGAAVFDISGGKITQAWMLSDDPATVDEVFA
jgi:hypothetical protein